MEERTLLWVCGRRWGKKDFVREFTLIFANCPASGGDAPAFSGVTRIKIFGTRIPQSGTQNAAQMDTDKKGNGKLAQMNADEIG